MQFPTLIPGTFIRRPNRFTAQVQLEGGKRITAYVPTTGRLTGALRPDCRVWLEYVPGEARKTHYTLLLSELMDGGLCSVNAALANKLFAESLLQGCLGMFPYNSLTPEVTVNQSRLDFQLSSGDRICWVEVKSVTYASGGTGMFPDAPTGRGRKHLVELVDLAAQGDRACAVFITQRPDAVRFKPFEAVDPDFAETLRQVHQAGVEVYAFRCDVCLSEIEIAENIPVDLG